MRSAFRWLLLLAGLALLLLNCAQAEDHIVARAALEDASGTLDIADVSARDFRPVGTSFSAGLTDSVYWLRLRVRAPADGKRLVIFIREPNINEIRLYEPAPEAPDGWRTRVTGNLVPVAERERGCCSLGFAVDIDAPEATYYLRITSKSALQLTALALTPDEATRLDHQFDLLEAVFVTAMLLLLARVTQSYFLDRQRVVGLFIIHQTLYTLFGMNVTGYLAPWLSNGSPALIQITSLLLYCAVSFTSLLFCRELFRPYAPPRLLLRGFDLLLLIFPLQLVLMTLGQFPAAYGINWGLNRFSWWYFVLTAFLLRQEHSPSRRVLQGFFLVVTLAFTAFWVTGSNGRLVLIANGLIIGGVFALMVNARSRQFLLEAQRSAMNLALAEKNLEHERALKVQAETQARTDYLTGLANRRHFFEQSERELARSLRFQKPFALMMIDIDHFKAINDTWGHSAGDQVLSEIARLIRTTLRDVDLFGRTGGEEFAAVVVETDRALASEVAQRLCAKVAATSIAVQPGAEIQVTISIGLTALAEPTASFGGLLDAADRLLYLAKQQGRNRVVASAG